MGPKAARQGPFRGAIRLQDATVCNLSDIALRRGLRLLGALQLPGTLPLKDDVPVCKPKAPRR